MVPYTTCELTELVEADVGELVDVVEVLNLSQLWSFWWNFISGTDEDGVDVGEVTVEAALEMYSLPKQVGSLQTRPASGGATYVVVGLTPGCLTR